MHPETKLTEQQLVVVQELAHLRERFQVRTITPDVMKNYWALRDKITTNLLSYLSHIAPDEVTVGVPTPKLESVPLVVYVHGSPKSAYLTQLAVHADKFIVGDNDLNRVVEDHRVHVRAWVEAISKVNELDLWVNAYLTGMLAHISNSYSYSCERATGRVTYRLKRGYTTSNVTSKLDELLVLAHTSTAMERNLLRNLLKTPRHEPVTSDMLAVALA